MKIRIANNANDEVQRMPRKIKSSSRLIWSLHLSLPNYLIHPLNQNCKSQLCFILFLHKKRYCAQQRAMQSAIQNTANEYLTISTTQSFMPCTFLRFKNHRLLSCRYTCVSMYVYIFIFTAVLSNQMGWGEGL